MLIDKNTWQGPQTRPIIRLPAVFVDRRIVLKTDG
jgi:hypothetical protein